MHGLSTRNLGVEKEKDKEKERVKGLGGRKAGISPSGTDSMPLGDGFGKNAIEGAMFGNDYQYETDSLNGVDDDLNVNPWASTTTSISTATLRSRHLGRPSSREFKYLHDEEDSPSYASDSRHEWKLDQRTKRRRRRSRSAIASTSKHPLYVDVDGDGDGHVERHFYRTHSESQSFGSHAGLSSSFDHQTRPSLRRAIGSLEGRKDDETKESTKGTERSDNLNVDVIVHKVVRTDTLAGLALKYNIPLAQLRKANKLWTNDSIHLRQVLYIPLKDVTSSSLLSKVLPSKSNTSQLNSDEQDKPSEFDFNTGTNSGTSRDDIPFTIHTQDQIRKVPHSQLSFFPPSSAATSNPSASISVTRSTPNHNTQRAHPPSINSSSSPSFSFTSLFQELNNATQEIKSRLSFDSYSSRHSSDPGDEGEIELGVVRKNRSDGGNDDVLAVFPSAFAINPSTPTMSSGHTQHPSHHFIENSISLPLQPPSTPPKAVIRSIQLQPSPEMKIPTASMYLRDDMKARHSISED